MVKTLRNLLLASLILPSLGCSTLSYYGQSISGQLDLLWKRQPVAELLDDATLAPELKDKLRMALAMRDFASRELQLPDNGSYRSYSDLQRDHVVWNVFAAPALSTELEKWCFPFAGCVGYKGYFAEGDARELAAQLQQQGMDVYVGGIDAYSTLGWFDDPLLNTIINRPPPLLAGLIFHELAHQEFYVQGDTAFNESFASTVEQEGVKRWLAQNGDAALHRAWEQYQRQRQDFLELVGGLRDRLQETYASDASDSDKLARKQQLIAELRAQYQQLRARWDGYRGYDKWFEGEINNAKLGSIAFYTDWVPAFQRLLADSGNDFPAFYRAVRRLGDMEPPQREQSLQALLPAPLTVYRRE